MQDNYDPVTPGRTLNEVLTFRSIQSLLLLVRLIALTIFALQTVRYVRFSLQTKGRIDKYAVATFVCLGLSFFNFFIYRGLDIGIDFAILVRYDSEKQQIIDWRARNNDLITIVSAVLRNIAYCLQNIALLVNIFSFLRNKRRLLFILSSLLVLISIIFLTMTLLAVHNFNFYFYPI